MWSFIICFPANMSTPGTHLAHVSNQSNIMDTYLERVHVGDRRIKGKKRDKMMDKAAGKAIDKTIDKTIDKDLSITEKAVIKLIATNPSITQKILHYPPKPSAKVSSYRQGTSTCGQDEGR